MMPRIDKLMWGIAADALSVVVAQVGVLVKACGVHEEARPIAAERIAQLRSMSSMLGQEADRLERELTGAAPLPTLAEQAAAFDSMLPRMDHDDLNGGT